MSATRITGTLIALAAIFALATPAFAGPDQILTNASFGQAPNGGLVADATGNLYGTVRQGGGGAGEVFELSPPTTSGGQWTETTLHIFAAPSATVDGVQPWGTLIFDKQGNLYGTTQYSTDAYGTVFELSPPSSLGGAWTETILYDFPLDTSRGAEPEGKLVFDSQGNLYGTTLYGGAGASSTTTGGGVIFRLAPPTTPGGPWRQAVLHSFGMTPTDGKNPGTALLIHNGVLYGVTQYGGANQDGIIFQLARQNGAWVVTDLHDFSGTDGANPYGAPIMDSAGNLYGTTSGGGIQNCHGLGGCGTAYELSPPSVAGNPWQLTTLHSFAGGVDGGASYAALLMDKAGSLYGTASAGGFKDNGIVFKLKPATGGGYTNVLLHVFVPPADGAAPFGELILRGGRLYGTTWAGGPGHFGIVFSVVP